jgi:transposase-like protein
MVMAFREQYPESVVEEWLRLRQEGATVEAIAKQFGVGMATVSRRVRALERKIQHDRALKQAAAAARKSGRHADPATRNPPGGAPERSDTTPLQSKDVALHVARTALAHRTKPKSASGRVGYIEGSRFTERDWLDQRDAERQARATAPPNPRCRIEDSDGRLRATCRRDNAERIAQALGLQGDWQIIPEPLRPATAASQ